MRIFLLWHCNSNQGRELAARGRNPNAEHWQANPKDLAYVSPGFVPFCQGQLELPHVASSLVETFSPLFSKSLPTVKLLQNSTTSMVVLELPVQGWKTPFFQEDDEHM